MSETAAAERVRVRLDGPVSLDGPVRVSSITEAVRIYDAEPIRVQGLVTLDTVDATTTPSPSQYATPRRVPSSASSVTLAQENPDRVGAIIYNDSTANLYVKFGITATTTDYSFLLYAGSAWEMGTRYTGRIDAIWASANGGAQVTEVF